LLGTPYSTHQKINGLSKHYQNNYANKGKDYGTVGTKFHNFHILSTVIEKAIAVKRKNFYRLSQL
jgi:hypothetical protein